MFAKRLALAAVVLAGLTPPALAREIVLSSPGRDRRIAVLDDEGNRRTLAIERRAIDPSGSPDHERVSIVSRAAGRRGGSRMPDASPSSSADGRRILFNTLKGLFSIRPEGSGRKKIEGTRPGDSCADW